MRFCIWFLILMSSATYSWYPTSEIEAIEVAEEFIVSNGYSSKRVCPAELQKLDDSDQYEMQPNCSAYEASERKAYAVLNVGIFWRVYFRKSPSETYDGKEIFRVIQIYPEHGARLHDVELSIDKNALLVKGGGSN